MKNILVRFGCALLTVSLLVSLMTSCGGEQTSGEPEMSETLALPDDTWKEVTLAEPVSEMAADDVNALVLEILGEGAQWNGDFSTLTQEQRNLIVNKMSQRGYSVTVTDKGITYMASAPAPTVEEFDTIIKKALGDDYVWSGDFASLTAEQAAKLISALKDAGYTAQIDGNTIVYSDPAAAPKNQKYYETPDEKTVDAVVESVIGKSEYAKWDGNFNSLDKDDAQQIVNTFNGVGYNVAVSDDGKKIESIEKKPETTTSAGSSEGGLKEVTTAATTASGETTTAVPAKQGYSVTLDSASVTNYGGAKGASYRSVAKTSDGGYVTVGSFAATLGDFADADSTWGGTKSFIIKRNSAGEIVWKDYIGVKKGSEFVYLYGVTELSDGGIVCVGEARCDKLYTITQNPTSFTTYGGNDAIMIKYDANGNFVFLKQFGGSNSDMFASVAAAEGGEFIVGGRTGSSDGTLSSVDTPYPWAAIIIRFTLDGEVRAQRYFGGNKSSSFDAIAVAPAPDGSIYAVCNTNSYEGFFNYMSSNISGDTAVMRFSRNLEPMWNDGKGVALYGSGTESFKSLTLTSDGCIVAGSFSASNLAEGVFNTCHNFGAQDAALVRISASGEVKDICSFGGLNNDIILGIAPVDGGYFVTGVTQSDNQVFANIMNKGQMDTFTAFIAEESGLLRFKAMASVAGSASDTPQGIIPLSGDTVMVVGLTHSRDGDFEGITPSGISGGVAYSANFKVSVS